MDPDRQDETPRQRQWFVFQAAVEGSGPFYIRDLIVLLVEFVGCCCFYACLGFTFQGISVASVLLWWSFGLKTLRHGKHVKLLSLRFKITFIFKPEQEYFRYLSGNV